jgi:hypothetical protein
MKEKISTIKEYKREIIAQYNDFVKSKLNPNVKNNTYMNIVEENDNYLVK